MVVPMIDFRGYRISVDDVLTCLRDIAEHPEYTSIFDNEFLGVFKQVHEEHDAKIHMNIYYQSVDGQFNLTMMPDRFKKEWKANANWLHLSFHALADKPDKPYANAGYDEVKHDCELVQAEIRRFAGEEVLGPVTTLHWGEATKDGVRALRDCGIKLLQADFVLVDDQPSISLYLNREQFDLVRKNCFWKDEETDVIFFACDAVMNSETISFIEPRMEYFQVLYPNRPFVDILIHEEYFYPTYRHYRSDYRERVLTGVRWCENHGYKPIFAMDMIGLTR